MTKLRDVIFLICAISLAKRVASFNLAHRVGYYFLQRQAFRPT